MKKLLSVLFSALLLCGIMMPAFAAEEVPDKPELVAAEIVSIPEKNKVVYTGGPPEDPDGIILKLVYSDKTEITAEIERRENGFFAGTEPVTQEGIVVQIIQYGMMTATLVLKNGEIRLSYAYESKQTDSDWDSPAARFFIQIRLFYLNHIYSPIRRALVQIRTIIKDMLGVQSRNWS